jgi:hypothetical protein
MENNIFIRRAFKYSKKILKGAKLGDKVHSIAKPIAQNLDEIFGTEIQSCGGCQKRREKLNNIFSSKLDT